MGDWIDSIEQKARIIHRELQAARELATSVGRDPDAISVPYFEMLAR